MLKNKRCPETPFLEGEITQTDKRGRVTSQAMLWSCVSRAARKDLPCLIWDRCGNSCGFRVWPLYAKEILLSEDAMHACDTWLCKSGIQLTSRILENLEHCQCRENSIWNDQSLNLCAAEREREQRERDRETEHSDGKATLSFHRHNFTKQQVLKHPNKHFSGQSYILNEKPKKCGMVTTWDYDNIGKSQFFFTIIPQMDHS